MMTDIKLTAGLRRILEFLASGGEEGRMEIQVLSSGGRAYSQLNKLRAAGYVESYYPEMVRGRQPPDRIRATEAGRAALAAH